MFEFDKDKYIAEEAASAAESHGYTIRSIFERVQTIETVRPLFEELEQMGFHLNGTYFGYTPSFAFKVKTCRELLPLFEFLEEHDWPCVSCDDYVGRKIREYTLQHNTTGGYINIRALLSAEDCEEIVVEEHTEVKRDVRLVCRGD